MQRLIERLWQELGFALVLVTHDVSEAVYLADRVVLIEAGHIQMNQPIELNRPHRKGPETIQYEKHILDGIMKPQKKIV